MPSLSKVGAVKKRPLKRKLFSLARVTHVYLSMGLLCLLLLFCVSGILLNHTQWLSGDSIDGSLEVDLPADISESLMGVAGTVFENPPLSQLQAFLMTEYNLKKVSDIELDEDAGEIIFDYKLPAGYAAAIVDVNQKTLVLDYRKGSFWLIVNDLHKGRNSGLHWSWVIDLSAGLMMFFSITGMVILFQNNKYRRVGLLLAAFGAMTPLCLYWLYVPRLAGV